MPKGTITLANGTVILIEGSLAELKDLLDHYGRSTTRQPDQSPPRKRRGRRSFTPSEPERPSTENKIAKIVGLVKSCDEADDIETRILDQSSQVDRILLPLYVAHQYMKDTLGLTSGEISKVTRELGVPVSQSNASTALAGSASRYVVGDTVRVRGQAVRYRLVRRGIKYIEAVIRGKPDA